MEGSKIAYSKSVSRSSDNELFYLMDLNQYLAFI